MTHRLQHWDSSLGSKLTKVQSKILLASQLPPSSASRNNLLADARKLLIRCRFTKTTYKSELARHPDDSDEQIRYEAKLIALEEEMVKAEEDLEALESCAVGIACIGGVGNTKTAGNPNDQGKQYGGGGRGGGGCAALPNAAMNAESKTYSQVHRLIDPLLDFTTSQCGCDPIAFAAGTGGRYEPQNSVVQEEEEYVDDREPSTTAPYAPYGDTMRKEPSRFRAKTGHRKHSDDSSFPNAKGNAVTSTEATLLESKTWPFSDNRAALEERGQRLEHLGDQTAKLESAAETFADLAKQLKEKAKQNH